MEAGYTSDEIAQLLAYATAVAPHHLATSAAHALGALAGDLDLTGWQPARYAPDLVAYLVLARRLPITKQVVTSLAEIAIPRDDPLHDPIGEQAMAVLCNMSSRVHAAGPMYLEWDPEGLEALHDLFEFAELNLLRSGAQRIAAAVDRGAHESWSAPAMAAALRMLEKMVSRGVETACDRALTKLLAVAPVEVALPAIGSADLSAESRRAALARLRVVSTDVTADATRYLASWLPTVRDGKRLGLRRGELGIVVAPPGLGTTSKAWTREQADWIRNAELDARLAACVGLVERGHPDALGLVEDAPELLASRLAARFDAAPSPDLATALARVGAPGALIAALAGDDRHAGPAEMALGVTPGAVADLLALAQGDDAVTALRADRSLAALRSDSARSHFEQLAVEAHGPRRWVALLTLRQLAANDASFSVVQRAYADAHGDERHVVLETAAVLARTEQHTAWILEQPLAAGSERELLERASWLADKPLPLRWLDRLVDGVIRDVQALLALEWSVRAELARRLHEHLIAFRRNDDHMERILRPQYEFRDGSAGSAQTLMMEDRRATAAPTLEPTACFTVLAPAAVAPAETFLVEVFVHSKAARESIASWTSIPDGRKFTAGPHLLAVGTTIDVALSVAGVSLDTAAGHVYWDGDIGCVQFSCTLGADALEPTYPGRATFSVEGLPIAETHFLIRVGPRTSGRGEATTSSKTFRSAFASYATPDRERVLNRIQGMQKVAPFVDIFLDVISLRSGDHWADAIRNEIVARDVLLLFWSRAASASQYVDTEWRIALEFKGLGGINPVPLESASIAPPPPELAPLHFYDWTLAIQ